MHQAVLKIHLGFPHPHRFLIWPEAHLCDDADRISQIAGCAKFDPLLFAGGHVVRFSGLLAGRHGEFDSAAGIRGEPLLLDGHAQVGGE